VTDIDGGGFIPCALAVWRLTNLLAREDGPFDVVFRMRRATGQGVLGSLLDCFYCLSLWIAAPFAFLLSQEWRTWIVCWLALSGAASLLFKLTERTSPEQGE
jgi:hypothetical protein